MQACPALARLRGLCRRRLPRCWPSGVAVCMASRSLRGRVAWKGTSTHIAVGRCPTSALRAWQLPRPLCLSSHAATAASSAVLQTPCTPACPPEACTRGCIHSPLLHLSRCERARVLQHGARRLGVHHCQLPAQLRPLLGFELRRHHRAASPRTPRLRRRRPAAVRSERSPLGRSPRQWPRGRGACATLAARHGGQVQHPQPRRQAHYAGAHTRRGCGASRLHLSGSPREPHGRVHACACVNACMHAYTIGLPSLSMPFAAAALDTAGHRPSMTWCAPSPDSAPEAHDPLRARGVSVRAPRAPQVHCFASAALPTPGQAGQSIGSQSRAPRRLSAPPHPLPSSFTCAPNPSGSFARTRSRAAGDEGGAEQRLVRLHRGGAAGETGEGMEARGGRRGAAG
eukprot:366548-Chlamydomonas_euryale.AAC.6